MRATLLMLAAMALAAAPPAGPQNEKQARMLRQQAKRWASSQDAWAAGKHADAIAYLEEVLRVEVTVFGPWHRETESTAKRLAEWLEARGEWGREAGYRRMVIEARRRLDGEGHWRTVDARWDLAEALARPKRTPAQQAAFNKAVALNRQADDLFNRGRAAEAVSLAQQSPALIAQALGERHPIYARSLDNLAGLLYEAGQYRAALPPRRQALSLRKELQGELHPDYADSLHKLANLYQALGDYRAALALYKQVLPLRREVLGTGHPDYAQSLNNLANLHHAMGDGKAAVALARQALELRRRVLGERHPAYAESLHNLGAILYELGDHAALPLLEQSLKLRKAVLGERHPHYLASLANLASYHRNRGDIDGALDLASRVLSLRKKALGERHPDYAASLTTLGMIHLGRGDHKAALPLLEAALKLRKEVFGERHEAYVNGLHGLANLHRTMGDYKVALPLYRQGLAISKEALGEKSSWHAVSLANLGGIHQAMGDNAAALPLYSQALAVYKEARGEKHPDYIGTLNNLANLYQAMGDHKGALPLFEKSLALAKDALGEKHTDHAQVLNNLALVHQALGNYEEALRLQKQALAGRKSLLGEKHPHYGESLHNLAFLYQDMGDPRSALPLCEQANSIAREAFGERHPEYAKGLHNLAYLHQDLGRHETAQRLFLQALAIIKDSLGGWHPSYAASLHSLGVQSLRMRRPGAALVFQEQSLAVTRRLLTADASVQSERQQIAAAAALRFRLNWRLSMPDGDASFSHNHVLAWKGSAFAAQQARRRFVLADAQPATRDLSMQLRDVTRSLALLKDRNDEGSRKRTEGLALRKQELESRLSFLSADFRLAVRPPTSEAFRASLPRGAVLIDLLVHNGLDPARPAEGQAGRRRLVAWVVRHDAATARLDLGPMKPIEEDIVAWRRAIGKGEGSEGAARLRERVWSPLEKYLAGAKVVLISPDEALGRLPFAALPGREKGKVLLEEWALAILPVPQVLTLLREPVKGKASLLALGAVDYGEGRGGWETLPSSGPEADDVAARFRGQFKVDASRLSGAKATKAAVTEALPKHRSAHLAIHGFFAPPTMRPHTEHKVKEAPGLLGRDGVSGWDPGMLSGLVLAGANRQRPGDDCILTASEVAEMDLSGMELAVLSACETGLGELAGGEGILGLQRAFAVSGCKSTVTSMWSVDDAATSVLMERFYLHLWEKKLSKLESLRQAQLDVLSHPEWVEERVKKLRGMPGLRGSGKSSEVVPGKKERRSLIAWWGAWQLSGDWR